jgi:exonuclease I
LPFFSFWTTTSPCSCSRSGSTTANQAADLAQTKSILQSFNVDRDILAKNLNIIKENINVLAAKLKPLFLKDFDHQNTSKDTDLMIYSGFFNEQEKKYAIAINTEAENWQSGLDSWLN